MDDQPFYLDGIVAAIGKVFNSYQIVGTTSIKEAIVCNMTSQPTIAILALNTYDAFTSIEIKEILKHNVRARIVILSTIDDSNIIASIMYAGAVGFLRKNVDSIELEQAIRTVMTGDSYCDGAFAILSRSFEFPKRITKPSPNFSQREREIIQLIIEGKTSRQIASKLALTLRTIETYRYNVLKKAGVKNTPELVNYIYKNRLQSII